jgi:hypothetical protein
LQSVIRTLIFALLAVPAFAGTEFWPDTTLSKETANNTSAASTFKTSVNGNIAAGNVSNVPVRSLLYPGSTTLILAHFMPWFGGTNHINVGYRSDDYDQVSRQIQDMKRRGIDGLVVDWYGPSGTREEQTTQYIRGYANSDLDFRYAITEDVGALKKCASTPGCNLTDRLIADLRYILNTYANDWGYLRVGSRPVIFFFGLEQYTLDWTRVRSTIGPQPMFIFRNSVGFSADQTDGAFAWMAPVTSDYDSYQSMPYLEGFYDRAIDSSQLLTVGSAFKGFNDVLASWAPPGGRHIAQMCGDTWLDTFATINRYYSSGNQLPMLQLNTWNDYEEGSAIETGIDNCFSITASVSGSNVNWTIIGPEQTIHTYRVFISDDGENLMKVKDVTPGARSLDLASYGFAAGTYKVYVKAIGKPSIVNRMSNAATFTVGGTTPPPTAPPDEPPTEPENPPAEDLTVSVLPSIVKVMQGENAMASVNIAGATDLNLSCKGLPTYASCSFGPVSGTASLATTTLTIRTSETVRVSRQRSRSLVALAFFGLSGVVVIAVDRRRVAWALCIVLLSGTMIGCSVFGKQETQSASHPELKVAPKGEFSLEVNAVKGTTQASTTMTVVVQ